jgi:triacylglycerol lipase
MPMNKNLKYFLIALLILIIAIILYFIIKFIIFYFNAKKALYNALTNSKYCGKEDCDPTPSQLIQTLPESININIWQQNVAKYCINIIYSIKIAALNKTKPIYPIDLISVKELYDNKNDPIFGTIFTQTQSDNIWISFRGSLTSNEWKEDFIMKQESLFQTPQNIKQVQLDFLTTSTGETANVHKGFVDIYTNFRNDLLSTIQQINTDKKKLIIISGHSIGAAVATLVAVDLAQSGYTNIVVYTFACPRIGDNTFKTIVDDTLKLPVYRVVNISDLIPNSPLSVQPNLNDTTNPYMYLHCGFLIPFQINRLSIKGNHGIPTYMAGLENKLVVIDRFQTVL